MENIDFLNGKIIKLLPYRNNEEVFKLCVDIIEENYKK